MQRVFRPIYLWVVRQTNSGLPINSSFYFSFMMFLQLLLFIIATSLYFHTSYTNCKCHPHHSQNCHWFKT